jgi:hypothetical protein
LGLERAYGQGIAVDLARRDGFFAQRRFRRYVVLGENKVFCETL